MAERAAAWCEGVFPEVPHRQWVLTVPWSRRAVLAYRPELAAGVLAGALAEVFGWLSDQASERLGVEDGRSGAVTVEQRFDSSLRLNLHYHCIVPDGVFARAEDGSLVFHRVSPTRADVDELVERIALRCERWLEARLEDDIPDEEEAQATLVAASAAGKVVSGEHAGRSVRRIRGEAVDARAGNGSSAQGYGLHAGTFVAAHDRVGLQHLARYLLRPPLARGRLEERPDGQVVLHLRKPWRDGTSAFVFTPQELVERLAASVVRPRVHTTHFHGVFAAHAAWRKELFGDCSARLPVAAALVMKRRRKGKKKPLRHAAPAWCPWSELLERVFGTSGLRCPHCGQPMTLRGVVSRPDAARRIVAGLRRSARAPPTPSVAP